MGIEWRTHLIDQSVSSYAERKDLSQGIDDVADRAECIDVDTVDL